jgi:hypothetical protein
MSILSTQSIIPNHSGLLELPASAVSGVPPIVLPAKEVVESVLIETAEPQIQDEVSEQEIAVEAFLLFEARGFEHGHDVEDWLAAEALVRQRRSGHGHSHYA